MKRWRGLRRLFEPFVGEDARRLRDEARDLARALTGARNAQSALDALADLEKHGLALSPRSVGGLRNRIEAIARAAETTLNGEMRLRLAGALDAAETAIERWPLHLVTFDNVADQLTRFYRGARGALPEDWPPAQAQGPPAVGQEGGSHRHQID